MKKSYTLGKTTSSEQLTYEQQKLTRTTNTVLVPNRITLQHCQKHRDQLNPNVEEFRPSPTKLTAAAVAKMKIRDIQQEGDDFYSLIK